MWDLTADGQTLADYAGGSFCATDGPTNTTHVPPLVNSGKGVLSRGRILKGTCTVRNCELSNISRTAGVHTDGIWLATDAKATGLTVNIVDCAIFNIAGEGLHYDGGALQRLLVQGTTVQSDDGNRVTVKLLPGCTVGEVVISDSSCNLIFDATHLAQPADAGKAVGTLYLSQQSGTVSVSVLVAGQVRQFSPAQVGITVVQGLPLDLQPKPAPTPPAPKPQQMQDVTGITLHRTSGDQQFRSGAGPVQLTLDGFSYVFKGA